MAHLSEDTILMCQKCRQKSGNGNMINVTYKFLAKPQGGYSPAWEGRVCEHVKAEEIWDHFGYELKDGKFVEKGSAQV